MRWTEPFAFTRTVSPDGLASPIGSAALMRRVPLTGRLPRPSAVMRHVEERVVLSRELRVGREGDTGDAMSSEQSQRARRVVGAEQRGGAIEQGIARHGQHDARHGELLLLAE